MEDYDASKLKVMNTALLSDGHLMDIQFMECMVTMKIKPP